MKKNYMQPLTEVVNVNAEEMICQSLTLGSNKYDGTSDILGKSRNNDYGEEDFFADDIWN